jgi:3-oxoacyl-[acyl-carrier protein] reductase
VVIDEKLTLLKGEVALVTGATRGIGKSIADEFAKAGAMVIGTATTKEGAENISNRLSSTDLDGHGIVLDVASTEQISETIKTLKQSNSMPSILVNNAGISLENLLMRIKDEEWEKVIAINLSSAFYLSKAVIGSMLKNRHGRIINIGSVQGSTGAPGHSHYSAAKAGLIGLTKSLAQEVGSRNITVNAISPGYVSTDMTKDIDEDMNQALLKQIPLKRFGKPIDIAKTAIYLASSSGSYITGETINVNGGMNML